MFEQLKSFLDRTTTNSQIVGLGLVGGFVLIFLWLLGNLLTPFLISIVVFYLLDNLTTKLQSHRLLNGYSRTLIAPVVLLLALCLLSLVLIILIPFALEQLLELLKNLSVILEEKHLDQHLANAIARLPFDVPESLPGEISDILRNYFLDSGHIESALNSGVLFTLTSAENLLIVAAWSVIIPVVIFFLLQDKIKISAWLGNLLPARLSLCQKVWARLNAKLGDYVRGKVIEIVILTSLCLAGFSLLGLNYAVLLSTLVGLSAIVPVLGLIVVTIPIVIIAWLQWGFSEWFWYLLLFYTAVQMADGYILIPLLFGEVVDLHPLAIVFGILFFGHWFGIWGVFFAIPLIILVHTILLLVPQEFREEKAETQGQQDAS